jgi:hypothetical protein
VSQPLALTVSQLSTTFGSGYAAPLSIDNNYATLAATQEHAAGSNWLSVQLPAPATSVLRVEVFNRRDFATIQFWLGTV